MAQQTRKWNPGDAANTFVRVILSDAGALLGGLSDDEWDKTRAWFDGRCAYTGEGLGEDRSEQDHAVPMNRAHCGLHLFGNVLPATRDANRRKAGKHYRDFVEDPDRLGHIEAFVRESGYWDKVSVFGDLQHYCEAQYRTIDALCRVNRQNLENLTREALEDGAESDPEPPEPSSSSWSTADTLPITLDPPSSEAFLVALLRERRAWIVEVHRDGRKVERLWDAGNMSVSSNVIGNLRSRPRYRKQAWKRLGIQSLVVSITRQHGDELLPTPLLDQPDTTSGLRQVNRELADVVRQDDIARIKVLIESGADVNGPAPKTSYTPLMWAKSPEATRTLIHAGASVHIRDQQGHTPLMWVISKNYVPDQAARIAQELVDAGADVNARDNNGMTSLDWARLHRNRLREPRLRHIAEQLVSILERKAPPH